MLLKNSSFPVTAHGNFSHLGFQNGVQELVFLSNNLYNHNHERLANTERGFCVFHCALHIVGTLKKLTKLYLIRPFLMISF